MLQLPIMTSPQTYHKATTTLCWYKNLQTFEFKYFIHGNTSLYTAYIRSRYCFFGLKYIVETRKRHNISHRPPHTQHTLLLFYLYRICYLVNYVIFNYSRSAADAEQWTRPPSPVSRAQVSSETANYYYFVCRSSFVGTNNDHIYFYRIDFVFLDNLNAWMLAEIIRYWVCLDK